MLVLVHASPELFNCFLVSTEDHTFVHLFLLVLWIFTFHFFSGKRCLVLFPSQRSDFVAQDLALLGDLAIRKLLFQLLLPLATSIAVHRVQELGIRADPTDVDTRWVLVLRREGIWVNNEEELQVVFDILDFRDLWHRGDLDDLLARLIVDEIVNITSEVLGILSWLSELLLGCLFKFLWPCQACSKSVAHML